MSRALGLTLLALFALGCEESIYYWPDAGPGPAPRPDAGPAPTVVGESLDGYHHQVGSFAVDDVTAHYDAYVLGGTAAITLSGPLRGADGRFELTVSVDSSDGFFDPRLAPDQTLEIRDEDGRVAGLDVASHVVDPTTPRGYYDEHGSDQIDVTISEGSVPGARRFQILAHYSNDIAFYGAGRFEVRP